MLPAQTHRYLPDAIKHDTFTNSIETEYANIAPSPVLHFRKESIAIYLVLSNQQQIN